MAKCGRTNAAGGGGIGSDELTAPKEYVLNTYTAVTSDSDDEKGIGTMPDNRTTTSNGAVPAIDSNRSGVPTRMGSHLQYTTNTSGQKVISISPPKGYYPGDETSFVNRPASDFGDATVSHVLSGHTFTSQDGLKLPGGVVVNSLLSFSVAAYSGRRVLAKWQNPKAAIGKPYSGVYIRYSTSGYPGKTGGTQIYKGAGNNISSGGQSQIYLDLPNLNTTYFFSVYPYVTCNSGELTGDVRNASIKTSSELNLTITGTQTVTIPIGFSRMDSFCVGGGGAGARGEDGTSSDAGSGGAGGAGGYTNTVIGTPISSGQVLACTVGAGGYSGTTPQPGGTTSVVRSGVTINSAVGGNSPKYAGGDGVDGGSGSGSGGYYNSNNAQGPGNNGGSDGGNGMGTWGGTGQGKTTRAFGLSSGTLFSGAGAGGGAGTGKTSHYGGIGGPGGGGNGGMGAYVISQSSEGTEWSWATSGAAPTPNTGSGGGGGGGGAKGTGATSEGMGGPGASGIILLRLY